MWSFKRFTSSTYRMFRFACARTPGSNFFSPVLSAWRVGGRLADALLDKYRREEGKLPENVAFYWMAGDIMSSDGEMYSEILRLLGVEPVWLSNGQVKSFSITPLEELGRPRIDVTVRSSGILRDNFPNCYELVDEAVRAVAALDEDPEQNYVRKHALAAMETDGVSFREATYRIFSSKAGTYGNGVNLAVLASAWKTEADLADVFVAWNGYAYGKDTQGAAAHAQLATNLSTVAVTFNKVQSDEYDLLGCCCYFGTLGGMTAAARQYSGNEVKPYYGDTREPEHVEVRDLADEIRRVVRTKLLNPKWIDGMKEHGYKGAADMMKRITRVYGWEAATREVDDWIFDDIAETFVNNDEMRQFFEENNPYAIEEIARRLLEAEQRGLWDADEQVLDSLKEHYLEIESWMEDLAGEGDFQGGGVDVMDKIPNATSIGNWQTPNVEQILALHPDAVIAYSSYQPKNLDQLLAANITVVSLDCYKLATLPSDARAIGALTGRENAAEVYARMVEDTVADVAARVKTIPQQDYPSVYFESYTDYTAAASGSGSNEMLVAAGGRNIAGDTMTSSMTFTELSGDPIQTKDLAIVTYYTDKNGTVYKNKQTATSAGTDLYGYTTLTRVPFINDMRYGYSGNNPDKDFGNFTWKSGDVLSTGSTAGTAALLAINSTSTPYTILNTTGFGSGSVVDVKILHVPSGQYIFDKEVIVQ